MCLSMLELYDFLNILDLPYRFYGDILAIYSDHAIHIWQETSAYKFCFVEPIKH